MDLESPHIRYRYRVRYRRFSFNILVLTFDIEERQEGWFRIRYRRLSFDVEGKNYDIVRDIVPDIVPDIVYINLTCHFEHAGPSLQRHGFGMELLAATTMRIGKWMVTIYVITKINFRVLKISARHRRKDTFPNSWPTCLARWTAHLLLMLDNQSDLLLMTDMILVKNTSPRHTALHIQSCCGCQQNWLSGLGQIFAKNH